MILFCTCIPVFFAKKTVWDFQFMITRNLMLSNMKKPHYIIHLKWGKSVKLSICIRISKNYDPY